MNAVVARSSRNPWRTFVSRPYDQLMRYLSLNWPRAWRCRIDLLVAFFLANAAICGLALRLANDETFLATGGPVYFSLVCTFFGLFWIISITRPSRLREVTRFNTEPSVLSISLGLLSLGIWPFILVASANARSHGWGDSLWLLLVDKPQGNASTPMAIMFIAVWLVAVFARLMNLSSIGMAILSTVVAIGCALVAIIGVAIVVGVAGQAEAQIAWIVAAIALVIAHIALIVLDLRAGVQSRLGRVLGMSLIWATPIPLSIVVAAAADAAAGTVTPVVATIWFAAAVGVADIASRLMSRVLLLPRA